MSKAINKDLLPQVGVYTSKNGSATVKITRKSLEVNQGKNVDEILDSISHAINSQSLVRANKLWDSLDTEIRHELVYHDAGAFNLELFSKLNLRGNIFHDAFITKNARLIFCLDVAPVSSAQYDHSFVELRSEFLSVCDQLNSSSRGKDVVLEFLKCFDPEILASLVRHEVAIHFIDELDSETEMEDERDDLNWEDYDPATIPIHNEFAAFERAFTEGGIIPTFLFCTHWLYYHVREIFDGIRNLLITTARERSCSIWKRTNKTYLSVNIDRLLERAEKIKFAVTPQLLGITPKRASLFNSPQNVFNQSGVTTVSPANEMLRLTRLYCAGSPLSNSLGKDQTSYFGINSKITSSILTESDYDTTIIQTFDQLRQALWDVVGFTQLHKWVSEQDNPDLLLESSGKKAIFNAMNILGNEAFHHSNKILFFSVEESRSFVERLYGWFGLVKIFNEIATKQKNFRKLASVKKGSLVWEENITCCTLIFQAVLNSEKLSFSLKDISRFCTAIRKPGMSDQFKKSFHLLAKENGAEIAGNILEEYIDTLVIKGQTIFGAAEDIRISSEDDLKMFNKVKGFAKVTSDQVTRLVTELVPYEEAKTIARNNLNASLLFLKGSAKYRKPAFAYFDYLLSTMYKESKVELNDPFSN